MLPGPFAGLCGRFWLGTVEPWRLARRVVGTTGRASVRESLFVSLLRTGLQRAGGDARARVVLSYSSFGIYCKGAGEIGLSRLLRAEAHFLVLSLRKRCGLCGGRARLTAVPVGLHLTKDMWRGNLIPVRRAVCFNTNGNGMYRRFGLQRRCGADAFAGVFWLEQGTGEGRQRSRMDQYGWKDWAEHGSHLPRGRPGSGRTGKALAINVLRNFGRGTAARTKCQMPSMERIRGIDSAPR